MNLADDNPPTAPARSIDRGPECLEPGESIRSEYPQLSRRDRAGRPLIYLDSAATALRPRAVIEAVVRVMSLHAANIHRAMHQVGDEATSLYERARKTVADFLGACDHEIVFLRNATEGLNLVARCWPMTGRVVTSLGEHHSNLLPWTNQVTRLAPMPDGRMDLAALGRELDRGDVRLVSVSHVSNVTGLENDVAEIARRVHARGGILVVDAAQSAPHVELDVVNLDCDFLVFSGHKLGGPTGCGVLFGKADHLERMDWYLRGGSTVEEVHEQGAVPKAPPWRFEAGTPPVEAAVGLAEAIHFLSRVGWDRIGGHQRTLARHAVDRINAALPRARIVGGNSDRAGPVSVVVPGVSPHLLARALSDRFGICARSGFMCAQPLHEALGLAGSLRFSFYLYNTPSELDVAVDALRTLIELEQVG